MSEVREQHNRRIARLHVEINKLEQSPYFPWLAPIIEDLIAIIRDDEDRIEALENKLAPFLEHGRD